MKYIDIHSHLNFSAYDSDREEVIERARKAEVAMINVGTQIDTSKKAIELAEKYDDVYATVGVHPIHTSASFHDKKELGEGGKEFTSRGETIDKDLYLELAKHPKVVAIGECGLDYYRTDPKLLEKQRQDFHTMIEIANEVGKPLMLHVRNNVRIPDVVRLSAVSSGMTGNEVEVTVGNAYQDALKILKEKAKVRVNFHFFAGTIGDLKDILDMGGTVSFTGVITFTHDYDELVKYAPLDRIMSETDCPFVTPVPYRGKRNEPVYVVEVVKTIARIRGEDEVVVARKLMENAENFFIKSSLFLH